ncbi:unnamed protein product, partial [Brachionus calyciflorus]
IGSSCQYDVKPCSSNPCLNNGICIDDLSNNVYKCKCLTKEDQTEIYFGRNCEFKTNFCQNETCSNNGYCIENQNNPKCKCFNSYKGDRCESKSNEIIVIETIARSTSIFAVIIIFLTYSDYLWLNNVIFAKEMQKLSPNFIQPKLPRSKELNELFDKTHPVVCDKVRLRQEKQNSAQSTTTEIIPIGSIVYLNFEGLLNKLEPRFKGPYTIKAHTKRCNYKVANALEEILPESFPLDKLKIVQQD